MKQIETYLESTNDANPIKVSFIQKSKYYLDFVGTIPLLSSVLSDKDMEDIIINKLQLSKPAFDIDSFYEAATELSVILKMAQIPHNRFSYELPVRSGTNKNPECTIESSGFIINAEAKCPRLPPVPKPVDDEQKMLVMKAAGRVPDFFGQFEQLKNDLEATDKNLKMVVGKNKDNTMKDFLQSANEKFADYRNDDEINILFVALDDVHNIQEWWHYLFENEGLFTTTPFVDPRTFSRVDVVIYSNLLYRHKNRDIINGSAWNLDDSFNLFMSNRYRQGPKENAHRYMLQFIKNFTEDMKKYKVPGDAPQYILEALQVAWFVKEELEKNRGQFYFEKQSET